MAHCPAHAAHGHDYEFRVFAAVGFNDAVAPPDQTFPFRITFLSYFDRPLHRLADVLAVLAEHLRADHIAERLASLRTQKVFRLERRQVSIHRFLGRYLDRFQCVGNIESILVNQYRA